jgi:rod shape-determining protein MreD
VNVLPRGAKASLVVLIGLVLHTAVLPNVRLADVRPDFMLLLAVLGGLAAGPQIGAVFGFACGLAVDLVLQSPLGLSALTFCLIGFAVGTFQGVLIRSAFWLTPAVAAAASGIGVLTFAVLGAVLGQSHLVHTGTLAVVGIVALLNGLLAPPAARAVAWALREDEAR